MMPALALGAMLTPLGLGEPFLIMARWDVEAMLAIGRFFGELPGAVRVVASAPAAALPVSFLGVLFLCLWRGPLRWLGLPFAAAVLLWPRPTPPDIWIGAEGNNAALRAGEQAIIVRPEVRQFATDLWTRRYALSPAASTTQACGRFSCVTEVGGTKLALWWGTRPPTSEALASFCQSAEVVSVRPKVTVLPEACRSRLVIDGRDREGGGAVEFYRHGDAWAARWAQPIRGDRPWARRPGPAPELSDSAG
jgi:competence protein ComEC